MTFIKAWYVGRNGKGVCPVLIVGIEKNNAVVWKLINNVVIERVVPLDKLYNYPWQETIIPEGVEHERSTRIEGWAGDGEREG